MFNFVTIKETKEYSRCGNKYELSLPLNSSKYIKYVRKAYESISRMYNSEGDLVGIDVRLEGGVEKEVIYNVSKGITIVILKDSKGNKFKGVAKCREGDIYNSQTGYEIAQCRAAIKKNEFRIKELSDNGVIGL